MEHAKIDNDPGPEKARGRLAVSDVSIFTCWFSAYIWQFIDATFSGYTVRISSRDDQSWDCLHGWGHGRWSDSLDC